MLSKWSAAENFCGHWQNLDSESEACFSALASPKNVLEDMIKAPISNRQREAGLEKFALKTAHTRSRILDADVS